MAGFFRKLAVTAAVRNHLVAKLVAERGYDRREARDAARDMGDDLIEQAFKEKKVKEPNVGAGGVLSWLLEFIQSDLFKQILEMLMDLFGPSEATARAAVKKETDDGEE